MARSVNKVILLGNLGKDAELQFLPSGTPVSKFTLATNRKFKDKNGEWQDETEWHNIVLWGPSAEKLTQYLTKGSKLYVEGRIKSRTWEKDGQKHYATDIVADQIVFVGGGRGEEGGGGGSSRPAHARPAAAASPQQGGGAAREESFSQEITDDDIPF